MKARTLQIKEALHSLKAAERAIEFQELANVYIELATELRRPLREGEATKRRGGLELGGRPDGEDFIQVSALEAASDHHRLALTGKPGSGKTTFVRHLCLCLAQHLRQPRHRDLSQSRLCRTGSPRARPAPRSPDGVQGGAPRGLRSSQNRSVRGGEQVLVEPVVSAVASGLVVPQKFVGKPNPMRQRAYPWGDEADPNLANFDESQAAATSTAGCFSGGCGPYGTLDQSGNVCEGTRSLWGEDWKEPTFRHPYTADPARHDLRAPKEVLRAVRGGSWVSDADSVRCAYRYGVNAGFRGGGIGFRVVASPFSRL